MFELVGVVSCIERSKRKDGTEYFRVYVQGRKETTEAFCDLDIINQNGVNEGETHRFRVRVSSRQAGQVTVVIESVVPQNLAATVNRLTNGAASVASGAVAGGVK